MESEPAIVVLSGLSSSGKSTVAEFMRDSLGFTPVAFVDPVKRFFHLAYDISPEVLWGPSSVRDAVVTIDLEEDVEKVDQIFTECFSVYSSIKVTRLASWKKFVKSASNVNISVRDLLIAFTEQLKEDVPDFILDTAYTTIDLLTRPSYTYDNTTGLTAVGSRKRVVITDLRFQTEKEFIEEEYPEAIRIRVRRADNEKDIHTHYTESVMNSLPDDYFTAILNNDGSKEDLYQDVESCLSSLGLSGLFAEEYQ